MRSFLKTVCKHVLVLLVSYTLFFLFLILLFVSLGTFFEEESVKVADETILVLDLAMGIPDSPVYASPIAVFHRSLMGLDSASLNLLAITKALERARDDDRIAGLFVHGSLRTDNYGSSFATLRETRDAILDFRESGKPVIAYMVTPSIRDYYVSSTAEMLFLDPSGLLKLNGLAAQMIFFGDAFTKYGIGVQVSQIGDYKSVGEIFTENRMSPKNRAQTQKVVDGIWTSIVGDIAVSRGLTPEQVRYAVRNTAIFKASQARDAGLVDAAAYLDEVLEKLNQVGEFDEDQESFRQVSLASYFREGNSLLESIAKEGKPIIAVVYAEGDIVTGEGKRNEVGGDRFARTLRRIRSDDDYKAVVLRVNSPGGGAVPSEMIEREVTLLAKKKPLVVSMGGYAASGGYWISSSAETIIAEAGTITGSIGVFGLYPNLEEIARRHGITFDGVKTDPYGDLFTIMRPKTEDELDRLRWLAERIYDDFLTNVSEGRDLSREAVELIASGRVWTGADAVEIGLVDRLGGLADAVDEAASLAGLSDEWVLQQVPREIEWSDLLDELLRGPRSDDPLARLSSISRMFTQLSGEFPFLTALNDPSGLYARLPFHFRLD